MNKEFSPNELKIVYASVYDTVFNCHQFGKLEESQINDVIQQAKKAIIRNSKLTFRKVCENHEEISTLVLHALAIKEKNCKAIRTKTDIGSIVCKCAQDEECPKIFVSLETSPGNLVPIANIEYTGEILALEDIPETEEYVDIDEKEIRVIVSSGIKCYSYE